MMMIYELGGDNRQEEDDDDFDDDGCGDVNDDDFFQRFYFVCSIKSLYNTVFYFLN